MLQKTVFIENPEETDSLCKELRMNPDFEKASDRLLLVWYELWQEAQVRDLSNRIRDIFPDVTVSATCFHCKDNILKTMTQAPAEGKLLISLLLFESSKVSVYAKKGAEKNETEIGRSLNLFMQKIPDVKGVFFNPSVYFFSIDDLLSSCREGFEEVPFFGMKTTLYPRYSNFYILPGKKPVFNTFHSVVFSGKDLNIRAHYNFGWTPLGKEMKITGLSSPTSVSHIDGMPAAYIYKKYLGLNPDQINPWNTCEFPVVQEKNGILSARIGMTDRDTKNLFFGYTFNIGDVIRLSYGNPDEIFKKIRKDGRKVKAFEPQAELLFICVNRLLVLKDNEHIETDYYTDHFKEAAYLYGFAEIVANKKCAGEFNSAFVSVAFREGEKTSPDLPVETEKKEIGDTSSLKIVPLEDKLFNFFTAMSEDLISAARSAEKANRAKSDFLSSVSHEIRTPINAILGMDEMILRETGEESVRSYAENISESGKLLLGLINDLLDTARIESGKMEIIPVDYDLSATLSDTINIITPKTGSKGLDFSVNVNPEIPHALTGDETRIKQCAINLLNNAVKYTPSGSVKLSVDYKPCGESKIELCISVSDTGMGIKPEDLSRLDKPFERLDSRHNYKVEGTGLGLTIVNGFLNLMGSRLDVESRYGSGSCFSFKVIQTVRSWEPLGDYTTARQRLGAKKESYHESFRAPDARILVTDDTEMNLIVITSLLKNTLMKIDTATSGQQALEMARDTKYDLILIDQQMPQMKGSRVLKAIREGGGINSDTVCIVLTADAVNGAREKYLSRGFNDYISKPVNGPAMEKVIMKYLPKEKLLPPGEEKRPEKTREDTKQQSFLSSMQSMEKVDYDTAVENAGSISTLKELVASFVRNSSDTSSVLKDTLSSSDSDGFTVRVHALKSSCRTIGALELSKKAAAYEELGIKGDLDSIRQDFDDFISDYESLVSGFKSCLEDKGPFEAEDLTPISNEDLSDYLHRMSLLIEDFDYDEAGMIADTLLTYDLKERRGEILKLKALLADFEGPAASELIKNIK